jgi:two-component system sensor histidine kinase TctE
VSCDPQSAISIRRRLLALLLPSLIALMLGGVYAHYRTAMLVLRRVSDQRLQDAVRSLGSRIEASKGVLDSGLRRSIDLGSSANDFGDLRYAVRAADGTILAGDSRVRAALGSATLAFADATLDGEPYRVATLHLRGRGGAATVSAAERDAIRAAPGHFILASSWLVDFVQVDVTLLLVWVAVHYGLKPLMAVRRQIEARSPRELQPLRAAEVPSEVKPLVDALNLLFEMLREAARSQRQFVADTAHQLRTPIAGLLAQLELLMQDHGARPLRARLAALHEGMTRLAHSTNQLLALARTDPTASIGDRPEPVDLATLVRKVAELQVTRAVASGHDLGVEVQPAAASGNPRLLEDLLGNLIDNALTHTPPGSRVTARCGIEDGRPFLEVEDDGPGIPPSERIRVRQRFYRIPGTRGRGCGLGLAIVEEVARQHGAALIIDAGREGAGTLARIEFESAVAPVPAPARRVPAGPSATDVTV